MDGRGAIVGKGGSEDRAGVEKRLARQHGAADPRTEWLGEKHSQMPLEIQHGLLEAVQHIPAGQETLRDNLESIEAWLIRRALSHHGGRRAATARKLGITREGLYKKMKRLGVE